MTKVLYILNHFVACGTCVTLLTIHINSNHMLNKLVSPPMYEATSSELAANCRRACRQLDMIRTFVLTPCFVLLCPDKWVMSEAEASVINYCHLSSYYTQSHATVASCRDTRRLLVCHVTTKCSWNNFIIDKKKFYVLGL